VSSPWSFKAQNRTSRGKLEKMIVQENAGKITECTLVRVWKSFEQHQAEQQDGKQDRRKASLLTEQAPTFGRRSAQEKGGQVWNVVYGSMRSRILTFRPRAFQHSEIHAGLLPAL